RRAALGRSSRANETRDDALLLRRLRAGVAPPDRVKSEAGFHRSARGLHISRTKVEIVFRAQGSNLSAGTTCGLSAPVLSWHCSSSSPRRSIPAELQRKRL